MSSCKLTMKLYPPLPLVLGNMAVQGGMPNSVCGLSFGDFAQSPVTILLEKKWTCGECNRVKKDEFMQTNHESIPAAATCSWQHGGPRQNA